MARVLYLSYDGIGEPLGRSQVLAYLKKLAAHHEISLISFEKPEHLQGSEFAHLRNELRMFQIHWTPLRYHKTPSALATAYDVLQGFVVVTWVQFKQGTQILHARSYVAGLMAWLIHCLWRTPYIFDIRGFWPEEKVESGVWKEGSLLFRITKKLESYFFRDAAAIVSLTDAAHPVIKELGARACIETVPTCADLENFVPKNKVIDRKHLTIGYVGAISRYRFDSVLDCFLLMQTQFKNCATKLLIINQGEHDKIRTLLREKNVSDSLYEIHRSSPQEMPSWIQKMDAALFFVDPTYAKIAMAPTKLAEFLGCGVPCLTNEGLGDTKEILRSHNVGTVIADLSLPSLKQGLEQLSALLLDPETPARCRETAENYFSLEDGASRYSRLYQKLFSPRLFDYEADRSGSNIP